MSEQKTKASAQPRLSNLSQTRRKLRTVTFSSGRARALWAVIGFAGLGGGYWLVAPTFNSTPSPPQPWGLFVTSNAQESGHGQSHSWFLDLEIAARNDCEHPATATGEVSFDEGKHRNPFTYRPTRLVIGIAGIHVLRAEIRGPEYATWREVPIARYNGTTIAEGHVARWRYADEGVEFRLTLMASKPAGFRSCYVASPALFEFKGEDTQAWVSASSNTEIYLREHRKHGRLAGASLTDAAVRMSVAGQEPDRAALDASAQLHHGDATLSCTALLPESPPEFREDPYFYTRTLRGESSCASVQTFRATDAADSLNRRVFFGGILISAAVSILLEVFLTGKLDADDSKH